MTVIQFPMDRVRPPDPEPEPETSLNCMDCTHMAIGNRGLYCTLFNEWIVYETVAEDCGQYELA